MFECHRRLELREIEPSQGLTTFMKGAAVVSAPRNGAHVISHL